MKRLREMLLGASLSALAGTVHAWDAGILGTRIFGSADARTRAQAIVARMTLDEKIVLAHGLFAPMAAGKAAKTLIQLAGHIDDIPRLGIPLVRESDTSIGDANRAEQRKGDVATALPSGLATVVARRAASTFSP